MLPSAQPRPEKFRHIWHQGRGPRISLWGEYSRKGSG